MKAHPTQLFALLFADGKYESLAKALEQTRDNMESAGEGHLWRFWKAALLAARGEYGEAETIAKTLGDSERIQARRLIVTTRAQKDQDWPSAISFFEQLWQASHSPADLLALCEVQLHAGNPTFVAERAKDLVNSVGTTAALRIALEGTLRMKNWRTCLELLHENSKIFPNGELPTDLRRLQISCEQRLGMLTDAVKHAEDLVTKEGTTENTALLFQLRVDAGQLKEATLPARQLLHHPETPASTLVRVGWVMRLTDPVLAEAALRKAVERGVSGPQETALATSLAHALPARDLQEILVPKMVEEAKKPNPFLRSMKFEELLTWKRESDERLNDATALLRAGRIPQVVWNRVANTPLAASSILAIGQEGNARDLSVFPAVFFQHGSRPIQTPNRAVKALYLDTSAYINAHELGILPLVERSFPSLMVPPSLRKSLVQQLDASKESQPDWDAARRQVIKIVDQKKIAIWSPPPARLGEPASRDGVSREWWLALEETNHRDGLMVDMWPKLRDDGEPFLPPVEILQRMTSGAALAEFLQEEGLISQSETKTALAEVASVSSGLPDATKPRNDQVIFIEQGVAEILAHAHILKPLVEAFKIVVPERAIMWLRYDQRAEELRNRVQSRIQMMIDRLRTSNQIKDFVLSEEVRGASPELNLDAATKTIAELLQAPAGDGHFVWVDDRFLNSHDTIGKVPTITTLELLDELQRGASLPNLGYFSYRHKLRKADFRYIHLKSDELLHYLMQAPERENRIVETAELAVLRKYFARAILDTGTIQIPPLNFAAPKPNGEIDFLVTATKGVIEVLEKIFATANQSERLQYARADWVLHAVWLDPSHLRVILGQTPLREFAPAQAIKIAGLGEDLLLSRGLNRGIFGDDERLRRYMTWIETRLLKDQQRCDDAARQIRSLLEKSVSESSRGRKQDQVRLAVMANWFLALPHRVRRSVRLNKDCRKALGITDRTVVNVADVAFKSSAFWVAAASAYDGAETKIAPVGGGEEFTVQLIRQNGHPTLTLRRAGMQEKWGMEDDALDLLGNDLKRRIAVLDAHPEWFESVASHSRQAKQRIARLKRGERVPRLDKIRQRSAWHFYKALEMRLTSTHSSTLSQMSPPDAKELASYLRLRSSSNGSLTAREFDLGAKRLVAELDLSEAFSRLASLPRNLPAAFLCEFDKLTNGGKKSFLSGLKNRTHSPLTRLHYLYLLRRGGSGFTSEARQLKRELLNPQAESNASAFLQVLSWSWNQLGDTSEETSVSPTMRLALAWAHAEPLFALLRRGSEAAQIETFFSSNNRLSPKETITGSAGEEDAAHPRHLTPSIFLICGIAWALRDDAAAFAADDPSLLTRASEVCFRQHESLRWPRLEWLDDPTFWSNGLGSFFGEPREILLKPILGPERSAELSSQRVFREIEAAVSSLETTPSNHDAWLILGALLRAPSSCPPALRARVKALIERYDVISGEFSETERFPILFAMAAQAWPIGGASLAEHLVKKIATFAQWLSERGEKTTFKRELAVLNCAEALARSAPPDRSAGLFVRAIDACLNAWPNLANSLPGGPGLFLALPPQQLAECWPLLMRLRRDCVTI
ncbi:MAG TPA: hypothetical protein VL171_09205 [Verrucomicrobiae bacterium]|nr:hypothetical protein [Verrucomicrobiae bacterium]